MSAKRVLYLHQYFSTPEGSTGTRSYEFARRLVAGGVNVTMVCGSAELGQTGLSGDFSNGMRRGTVDGIDVIELDTAFSNKDPIAKRIWKFIRFSLRLSAVAWREKYDLAFATSTPLTIAIPALVARWIKRKPMIFEVRDLWPEMPRSMGLIKNPVLLKAADILEWSAYRSAAHCVALSPGIAEGIADKGVDLSSISEIPNGCDLELAENADPSDGDVLLKEAGIPLHAKVAVFTGAHGMANGLDALLDAAAIISTQDEGNELYFLLVGDGSEKARLQKRVSDEALDRIRFLAPVPKRRLFALLRRADLGLMMLKNVPAFYRGTSPNKFFDYLSCGLPIVVNYPGWMAKMVDDNQCGWTVRPDDAQAFAQTLIEAANSSEGNTKGANGKALAQSKFDRETLGEAFVSVIKSNL